MVRIHPLLLQKRTSILSITFVLLVVATSAVLMITGGKSDVVEAQSGSRYTVFANSTPGYGSTQISSVSLSGYRQYRDMSYWPMRTEGCPVNSTTIYKSQPWLGATAAMYGAFQTNGSGGNLMTSSGDCFNRFRDGGGYHPVNNMTGKEDSYGAWLKPNAMNGWAQNTSSFQGNATVSRIASSKFEPLCSSTGAFIWALPRNKTDTRNYDDHSVSLFQGNNWQYSTAAPPDDWKLYGNGVMVLRNNFNISAADFSTLNQSSTDVYIRALADDWIRVYVNGYLVGTSTYTGQDVESYSFAKYYLRQGANSISIQAVDKSQWARSYPYSTSTIGYGMCYTLEMKSVATPPSCPAGYQGTPPNCVRPSCPSGQTGSPPNCVTPPPVAAPPTCGVVRFFIGGGASVTSVAAGSSFGTSVTAYNSNATPTGIISASYSVNNAPAGSTNTSGVYTGVASIPGKSGPNNGTRTYSSGEDITIAGSGNYLVAWRLQYSTGTLICASSISTSVEPLSCKVSPVEASLGTKFKVAVTLGNSNNSPVVVNSSDWQVATASPPNGKGFQLSTGTPLNRANGGGVTIPAGTVAAPTYITIESEENITVASDGAKSVSWSVMTQNAGTSNCNDPALTVVRQPYARFYGNDVITGGGFGSTSCNTSLDKGARGYGGFSGAGNTHANYTGSAVELALFATGQINGVLPGSQNTGRSPLTALSLANTGGASGSLDFGGNFGSNICSDDFLTTDTTGFQNIPGTGLNLNAPATNGDYTYTGNVQVGGAVGVGKRIQIFVDGNVYINNNIIYAGSTTWGSVADIPLLRIYATGDIYIDGNVTEINGLFVAGGTIHTCTNGSTKYNISSPADQAAVISGCKNKLTVVGSFVAPKIDFLRVNGSYGGAPIAPELANSANIAEVFVFSPEMYLALLAEGSDGNSTALDSILSLPPAL